jgi:hypothetical protein
VHGDAVSTQCNGGATSPLHEIGMKSLTTVGVWVVNRNRAARRSVMLGWPGERGLSSTSTSTKTGWSSGAPPGTTAKDAGNVKSVGAPVRVHRCVSG